MRSEGADAKNVDGFALCRETHRLLSVKSYGIPSDVAPAQR